MDEMEKGQNETTPEQKAQAALAELQAVRVAQIQKVTEQITKLLRDNDCDVIVEHNIKVVPRQK